MDDPTPTHRAVGREMRALARRGWYLGDEVTLRHFGARRLVSSTSGELIISLLLSRDKMHHSVGWWRNADYEYCWHLSLAAQPLGDWGGSERNVEIPREDERYWARVIFGGHIDKLWHEPGGTDPRLTTQEKINRAPMRHLRLFLEPESVSERLIPWTGVPFIPKGEVYHLTRWIPGLTPEKVDR